MAAGALSSTVTRLAPGPRPHAGRPRRRSIAQAARPRRRRGPRTPRRVAARSAGRSRRDARRGRRRCTRAGQRHRAPEQRRRVVEVAGRDRRADLGAADRAAVEREWLHDDDVEAVAAAELGQGLGRAPALEAERRVRGHQEPAQVDPRAGSARRRRRTASRAERCVEVLDDRDRRRRPPRAARAARPGRAAAAARARSGPRRDGGRR